MNLKSEKHNCYHNPVVGADRLSQQLKSLAIKPDRLRSPLPNDGRKKPTPNSCPLLHTYQGHTHVTNTHTQAHIHKHTH